jgi:hypothetical protein
MIRVVHQFRNSGAVLAAVTTAAIGRSVPIRTMLAIQTEDT